MDKKKKKIEEPEKKIKDSSKRMKKIMKVVATITAFVVVAGTAFGIAGAVSNKRQDEANTIAISQLIDFRNEDAKISAAKLVEETKKESYERNLLINNQYWDLNGIIVDENLFSSLPRNEYVGSNVSYNIVHYKDITIYIDPSVPSERKSLIREAIQYYNNVFHTINPDITIKETSSLTHSPNCIHITDNETYQNSSDSIVGNTYIYYPGEEKFNDAIDVEIFPKQLNSYGHNEEIFQTAYKTVVMHEIFHALGFPHISEYLDESGRFNTGIRYNELNKPLMSRTMKSTPNDRLSPQELAGLFGVVNRLEYEELRSKTDKSDYYSRLNADYKKYLSLLEYTLNQSRGYKLGNTSADNLENNQVIQLCYEDKINNLNCQVTLTLNYPYAGFYQKQVSCEDGTGYGFSAPLFTTKDKDGNCKYSLLAEDSKSFDICNLYVNGNRSKVVANDMTAQEVKDKIQDLDPNLGYYIIENGSYDKSFVYTTQNFWQQLFNTYQDNTLYYEESLFTLYQTSPNWIMNNSSGNSITLTETTNELDLQIDNGNQRG